MANEVAENAWGVIIHHEDDRHIIPRYNAAGTKKFAFHGPKGPDAMEAGGQPLIDGPASFPTARFTDRQHALDWFRTG